MNDEGDWNNDGAEDAANDNDGGLVRRREERVRLQFENNDVDLVELWIGASNYAHCYLPPDGDWARDGRSIGQNTSIKVLRINDLGQEYFGQEAVPSEGIEQFLHGILENRSIKELYLHKCNLNDGDIFSVLTPFFRTNKSFECMEITHCRWSYEGQSSLASMLGQFSSLKTFKLTEADDHVDGADGSRDIIEALSGHSNLKKLRLGIDLRGIATLLHNPQSTLAVLEIRCDNIDDEGATNLAHGLACNSTIKELDISYISTITDKGWRAIFLALMSQTCILESLSLRGNEINDATALSLAHLLNNSSTLKVLDLIDIDQGRLSIASWGVICECLQSPKCKLEVLELAGAAIPNNDCMISLARSLATNTSLRELDLSETSYTNGLTTIGWNAFWDVLQNPTSNLAKLDLGDNSINDESIVVLTDALAGNTKLKELDLGGSDITAAGWEHFFSAVLRNTDSALEKLHLRANAIDNDGTMTALAEALRNNSKLRELSIWFHPRHQDVTTVVWPVFSFTRLLCDESSIDATYNSNHTLQRICDDKDLDRLPEGLQSLLCANQEHCKSTVARLKVIGTHFTGENINIQPFIEMDSKVLPHAIYWMTNDCGKDAESAWGKGFDLTHEVVSRVVVPKLFG